MEDPTERSSTTLPTLAAFVGNEWLPLMRGRLKPSTWDSYRRNMELHVLPTLGQHLISDISARDLNGLYGRLLEGGRRKGPGGLSISTTRYIHVILHGVFADAVDLGAAADNPAAKAKPPRATSGATHEMRVWNAAELQQFLSSIRDEPLYAAFHLAALTGMRRGEVLGLRWGDVDLVTRHVVVRHTLISIAYEVVESTPKTHRPRLVELDTGTASAVEHYGDQSRAGSRGGNASDLVFTDEHGVRVHPDLFTQRFDRLVARSGLPRIRLHDLRHTHATLGLAAGVPVRVMSERLGHASPEFTMKQYVHVLPGMQAAAAQQIADLVGGGD